LQRKNPKKKPLAKSVRGGEKETSPRKKRKKILEKKKVWWLRSPWPSRGERRRLRPAVEKKRKNSIQKKKGPCRTHLAGRGEAKKSMKKKKKGGVDPG